MSKTVNAYWLRLLDSDRYDECDYGKHLLLKYPDAENRLQRRSYSIAGRPDRGLIEIAVKRQPGHGVSASIHQSLTANSMLIVDEVSGALTGKSLLCYRSVLMVCGGVGITLPLGLARGLAALAEQGTEVPNVHLIVCVPQLSDLIYFTELLALQARFQWLTVATFVTQERVRTGISYLASGRPDPDGLANSIAPPEAIVICGSGSFVVDWERKLLRSFPYAVILDQHRAAPEDAGVGKASPSPKDRLCTFNLAHSNRLVTGSQDDTLLETLEANGVLVPNQCRMGVCGRCSVRLIDGDVESSSDIGLTNRERERGGRLACCSRPVGKTITLAL